MIALASSARLLRRVRRRDLLTLVVSLGVPSLSLITACGGGASYSSPAQSSPTPAGAVSAARSGDPAVSAINAVQRDFAITLDKKMASAGEVTFNVKNEGPSVHEFVVFKTDVAPDALPVESNKVDEESSEVTHVDEVEDVGAGEMKQLSVTLDPGHYVLICNLPAHYGLGMRAEFEVS